MKSKRFSKVVFLAIALCAARLATAQETVKPDVTASGIHIGERLSYNISFQRYDNVGYAEMYAVSKGKLGDAEAIELRMRAKTTGLLSAAFYQLDESRTTFANPETGSPMLVKRQDNGSVAVKETVTNYLNSPSAGFDLLTLMYKVRQAGGSGSFILSEGERTYSVTFQPQQSEHVRTDAGEFDTLISIVQSEYLTEHGILSMRINFSTDEAHVPVLFRFKTGKGEFRVTLSGRLISEPEVEATPTPVVTPTPKPVSTPKPTPTPFVENEPLAAELGFQLGEKLTYRVSSGGKGVATLQFQAKERKQIGRFDTLVLQAAVMSAEQGNGIFSNGDVIVANVDPDTLSPFDVVTRLSGPLAKFNLPTKFDHRTGAVTYGGDRVDAPIGTHSLLSLIYAVRSFNLTPSRDARNPVNDTRVAVFWNSRANIFMLRPSEPETITVNGQSFSAQKVTVRTNDPQLDQLGLTIWLSTDTSRTPLMFKVGPYQAELVAATRAPLK